MHQYYPEICTLLLSLLWLFMPHLQCHIPLQTESNLLPDSTSLFLGREKEVSELVSLLDLQSDDMRLVNIMGPTGIGKSAVAVEVGCQLGGRGAEVSYVDISLIPLNSVPSQPLQNAKTGKRAVAQTARTSDHNIR